jgi:hypothetical protein
MDALENEMMFNLLRLRTRMRKPFLSFGWLLFISLASTGCALHEPQVAEQSETVADQKATMRSKLLPSSKVGSTPFGTGLDSRAKEIEKSLGLR